MIRILAIVYVLWTTNCTTTIALAADMVAGKAKAKASAASAVCHGALGLSAMPNAPRCPASRELI